jgi:hypothetical protein
MGMVKCINCGTTVMPMVDGTCPACRLPHDAVVASPTAPMTPAPGTGQYVFWYAFLALTLWVAVAAVRGLCDLFNPHGPAGRTVVQVGLTVALCCPLFLCLCMVVRLHRRARRAARDYERELRSRATRGPTSPDEGTDTPSN